jgi:hypothetical protein
MRKEVRFVFSSWVFSFLQIEELITHELKVLSVGSGF